MSKDKIVGGFVDSQKTPSIKYGIGESGNLYRLQITQEPIASVTWALVSKPPDKSE